MLIITVSFQPDGLIVQDERESRKEQLLQVGQRVQSEYSFRYVALGGTSHEDLSGLASTDEYVIIIIIINICHLYFGRRRILIPESSEKIPSSRVESNSQPFWSEF